nr:SusE domain-containing protein [Pseudopedobacter sp.]
MKKIIQSFMILSFIAVAFTACKKDETQAVLDPAKIVASNLSASKNSLVLTKTDQANSAVTFTYSKANFGFSAGATYSLQFAVKGTNFASPQEVSLDATGTTKSFTVLDFNALMLKLNLPFDQASTIQTRVKAILSSNVAPTYSSIVEMSVKPYPLIDYIYVPGDYQGWTPSTADSLISPTGNGVYSGVIDFGAKVGGSLEFKLTPKKEWAVAYGDAGGSKISASAGNNLKVGTEYQYKLTADLNAKTFAAEKYSFGIIGDATPTGWGSDSNMKYNNGTRTWSITVRLLGGKDIKFRLNDDWATNYGGKDGVASLNGDNIRITADGIYKVSFSEVDKTYSVVKQ